MGADLQVAEKKNHASDQDSVDGGTVVEIGPLSLLVALRMRNTSTKSESLSWLAFICSLCFRFMAFLISWAHFFFWSFNAFWAS